MKRFLALWVVTIVIGTLAGFALGVIDYFFSVLGETSYGSECWESIMSGACQPDRPMYLIIYALCSLLITVPGYPIVRGIIGSFKIVFGKTKETK